MVRELTGISSASWDSPWTLRCDRQLFSESVRNRFLDHTSGCRCYVKLGWSGPKLHACDNSVHYFWRYERRCTIGRDKSWNSESESDRSLHTDKQMQIGVLSGDVGPLHQRWDLVRTHINLSSFGHSGSGSG